MEISPSAFSSQPQKKIQSGCRPCEAIINCLQEGKPLRCGDLCGEQTGTGCPSQPPRRAALCSQESLVQRGLKTEGLPGHMIQTVSSHLLEIFQWELTQTTLLGDFTIFGKENTKGWREPSNAEPPCGAYEGLLPVLLSSCREPRLHCQILTLGRKAGRWCRVGWGVPGRVAARPDSLLQPQASDDQARDPHQLGRGQGRRHPLWTFLVLTLRRHPQRLNVYAVETK